MRGTVAKRLRRQAVAQATASAKLITDPVRWISHGLSSYPKGERARRKHEARRKRGHWGGTTSRYQAGSWRRIYRALKRLHRGGAA